MTRSSDSDPGPDAAAAFGFADSSSTWMQHLREALREEPLGNLGEYELVEEVSRGGQGIVYRARQPGTGRDVALKRVIAGSFASAEMIARFEREAHAVASLRHPGIVTAYGVETIEGSLVLAMEWIDGRPVDRWARGEHAEPPGRDAILRLFVHICEAVQHAHQHGVVHRDLKPSNILVDAAGQPRVLDFGLAKHAGDARSELTRSGGFLGTPAYAAPEQHETGSGHADTRSDVYALGVILYEMLTGQRPYRPEAGMREFLAAVDREDAARPSALRRDLDGEIDAIVLHALASDPADRYQSVGALADDLRRYLAREPILAHPPSTWYELRKFVRRNRSVCALSALLFVSSLAFAATAWWQSGVIAAERDAEADARQSAQTSAELAKQAEARARDEAETNAAILTFVLEDILASANPMRLGASATIGDAIDHAAARAESRFAGHPDLLAEVRRVIGRVYGEIGRFDRAERELRASLDRLEGSARDPQTIASAEFALAVALHNQARSDEAIPLFERAIARIDGTPSPDYQSLSVARRELAHSLVQSGRLDEAEEQYALGLAILDAHRPDDHGERVRFLMGQALVASQRRRLDEARALYDRALELETTHFDSDTVRTADILGYLSDIDHVEGEQDDAIRRSRRSLEIIRARYDGDHPKLVTAIGDLGGLLMSKQDRPEGIALMREAIAMSSRIRGPDSIITHIHKTRLAMLLARDGEFDAAEHLFVPAIESFDAYPGRMPWQTRARHELALMHQQQRDWSKAAEQFRILVETQRPPSPGVALSRLLVGRCRALLELGESADPELDELFDVGVLRERTQPAPRRHRWRQLMTWFGEWGFPAAAERLRQRGVEAGLDRG